MGERFLQLPLGGVERVGVDATRREALTSVGEVLTVHSSPDQITAMLSVDFDDMISAREVERIVFGIEREVATRFPLVKRLYIRPHSREDEAVPIDA